VSWYQQAAQQGHTSAQSILGAMYVMGKGVPQSYLQAYAWGSVAAANGDAKAIELRDLAAELLTAAQLNEGQRLAAQYFAQSQKK
ncbi:MAG: hypothetical protein ACRDCX_00995, partial [Aeromonas sp.]